MSFKYERVNSLAWTGTAITVITPSIDVSNYDRFSIQIENNLTATHGALVHLAMQVSNHPADSAADSAPNWVSANSTTFPLASALGATAGLMTIPYNNAYRFIRLEAARSGTGAAGSVSAGSLIVTVAGFQRRDG
jgi:hypothetical protein